ncbi:hypothetical protein [Porticoccus sp.]
MSSIKTANVKFIGRKPLLFDRYTDNDTKLAPIDKVYWFDNRAVIPQINIYSGLCAEVTKSVAKMFFGKKAKPIGMAISNQLIIEEEFIPLTNDKGEFFSHENFERDFEVLHHVARINKGGVAIPNPKERPSLPLPWQLSFQIQFIPAGDVTWSVMQQCFEYLGVIGLGTYRPLFGGFRTEIAES